MTELDIQSKKKELLDYPNVQAVGRGKPEGERHDDDVVLVAYVTSKITEDDLEEDEVLPKEVEDFSVDVQEVGELSIEMPLEPQESVENESVETTGRHRPAPHGVSAGHVDITAGTAGTILWAEEKVKDFTVAVPKSVSNNHVYANKNKAEAGDKILQPGPYDGGSESDAVATLDDYVELTSKNNKVDVAWADINGRDMNSYIPTVGVPQEKTGVSVGDKIEKFGRTTAKRTGEVKSTDATLRVNFGDEVKEFEDQVLASSFSAGGDSGSAVVNKEGDLAGLIFAGSEKVTVVNKIDNVLDETGLHMKPEDIYED